MTCFDGIARWHSLLSVQSLRRCPWWIFFYHMGLLMQQGICSVMYCRSPCFPFWLESSGYTILCSHTWLQGLGICTFSWHMHWQVLLHWNSQFCYDYCSCPFWINCDIILNRLWYIYIINYMFIFNTHLSIDSQFQPLW